MGEVETKKNLRTGLVTLVVMGVLFCIFAAWYHRAYPPYVWPVIPPPTPVPRPNARDIYNAAFGLRVSDMVVGNGWLQPLHPDKYWPIQPQSVIDKAAADNLPLVATVRAGFKYDYAAPDYVPRSAEDRDLSRILLFEGLYNEEQHNYDAALRVEIDDMRFASDLWKGDGILGPMTGISCCAIGRRHAWGLVNKVSVAAARTAAMRIQAIDATMPSTAVIFRKGEVEQQRSLMESFRDPNWRDKIFQQEIANIGTHGFLRDQMLRAQINSVSNETVMKATTAFIDAQIRNSALPYSFYLSTPDPKMPADIISKGVAYQCNPLRREREACFTLDELLATMLALKAYRADHGTYPPVLAGLTPKYLARVPMDTFTVGSPLTYHVTKAGYLLYSIGPDGKDDGGKPIANAKEKAGSRFRYQVRATIIDADIQSGDIVAGVNY